MTTKNVVRITFTGDQLAALVKYIAELEDSIALDWPGVSDDRTKETKEALNILRAC